MNIDISTVDPQSARAAVIKQLKEVTVPGINHQLAEKWAADCKNWFESNLINRDRGFTVTAKPARIRQWIVVDVPINLDDPIMGTLPWVKLVEGDYFAPDCPDLPALPSPPPPGNISIGGFVGNSPNWRQAKADDTMPGDFILTDTDGSKWRKVLVPWGGLYERVR